MTRIADFEQRYASTGNNIGLARSEVEVWLKGIASTADKQQDILLIVSELSSNAVQAEGPYFDLTLSHHPPELVTIKVFNQVSPTLTGRRIPSIHTRLGDDPLSEHGRGLGIVKALSLSVCVDQHLNGDVTVEAVVQLDKGCDERLISGDN